MTYFLGRDIAVGLTTEQPHYALELDSGDLKISGTASNAFDATKVFVPKRNAIGTTAEKTTITFASNAKADYESLEGNNKYILVYSESGEKYLIWFDHDTTGEKPLGLNEDFEQEIDISAEASADQIASAVRGQLGSDTAFAAAFNITGSSTTCILENKVTGTAVDTVRGSGFSNSELTVAVTTDGANDDLTDLTNGVVLKDVTGLDFTYGTTDEDVSYFGQQTALKAEIKKEVTLTITKKKKNAGYSQLAKEARCGVRSTSSTTSEMTESSDDVEMDNNLDQPFVDTQGSGYGYRLYLQMKKGNEVLSLPNMCISEYSVSLSADAIQEETIVFYGNVTPIMGTLPDDTETSEANF
tara:strand:+ start:483 stop:1550 length:1068 start_codon:yes stop_codon:yes gene_type:complete